MVDHHADSKTVLFWGRVSAEDVELARIVHRRGNGFWKLVALVTTALAAGILADAVLHPHQQHGEALSFAFEILTLAIGLLAFAFVAPRRWLPHESPGDLIVRTITSEGIHIEDEGAEGFISWDAVVRSRTSDDLCIVYMRGIPAKCIFPRHLCVKSEDWTGFRRLLDARNL